MEQLDSSKSKIQNITIERDFLSGLIRFPESLYEIETFISEQDFASPQASKMFTVFRYLIIEKDIKKLDSAIILATVSNLKYTFPPECNVGTYVQNLVNGSSGIEYKTVILLARDIKLFSVRREIFAFGSKLQKNMIEGHSFGNIQEIIAVADGVYFDAMKNIAVDDDMVQLGEGAGEILHKRADAPVDRSGFGSGFPIFDDLIGYFRPDSFNFVSGRGKAGKSMFGLNVATHVARVEKLPVFYADGEMGRVMVRDRLIAHIAGVDIDYVEHGTWKQHPEVCMKVQKAIPIVESMNIQYHSIRAGNATTMISACRRFLFKKVKRNADQEWNPCLFIWDYIKLDYYNEKSIGNNWWLDIAKSVVHFKDFLGATKTTALVLGQQNQSGIAKLDKDKKLVTQDNESVVAGSDEIVKTSSNVSQLRFKTPEEIKRDGTDAGNCMLMPFVTRTGRGGDWVQLSEGVFEREYVCLERTPEKMTFKEITSNRLIRKKQSISDALK